MNITRIAGDNIRGFRSKMEWTQEKLAVRVGLHNSYIGKVERGEATISITNLAKLAKVLKVTPQILLIENAYKLTDDELKSLP